MRPHELIQHSFRSMSPSEDLEQRILSAAEEKRCPLRIIPRTLIAVAVVCCLVLSIAAVGYTAGWLDPWIDTGSNPEYFQENTHYPQAEGSVDGFTVTLDSFLCEGPFVYYQVTLKSETGFSWDSYWNDVHTEIAYAQPKACTDPTGEQQRYDYGPGSSGAEQRLDDGSDPTVRVYSIRLALNGYEQYEDTTLLLSISKAPSRAEAEAVPPEGIPLKELLRYEFTPEDRNFREAALEDGTKLRINSLGVGIQGYSFFGWEDETGAFTMGSLDATACGVVLRDGTRLNFLTSTLGYDEYTPSEEYWNNSPLPQVIDPQDVTAIFTEDAVYPLV